MAEEAAAVPPVEGLHGPGDDPHEFCNRFRVLVPGLELDEREEVVLASLFSMCLHAVVFVPFHWLHGRFLDCGPGFVCIIEFRLSEEGRAKATHTWRPTILVRTCCNELSWAERQVLGNKVLLVAKALRLEVADPAPHAPPLFYYEQVEHILVDGKLPPIFDVEVPGVTAKAQRYAVYRCLGDSFKGTWRLCL